MPAGQIVGVNLRRIMKRELKMGQVISDPNNDPCRDTMRFIAQIIVVNLQNPIKSGWIPLVFCNLAKAACRLESILAKVDKKTGTVIEEAP